MPSTHIRHSALIGAEVTADWSAMQPSPVCLALGLVGDVGERLLDGALPAGADRVDSPRP